MASPGSYRVVAPMPPEQKPARPWTHHAIGLFALFHVVTVLFIAFDESPFETGALGTLGGGWNAVQRPVERVGRIYGALLGPKQSWSMFGAVGKKNALLHISIDTADEKNREIYVARSDSADWNRTTFDHYRWREMFHTLGRTRNPGRRFDRFVEWVGPRVAADHPEACVVRVSFRVSDALSPAALVAGEPFVYDEERRAKRYRVPGRTCRR